MEQFFSTLKELAENCDFENREEAMIGDVFIKNMLDDDIQRKLWRDTVEPERALSNAVNMAMGNPKDKRVSSNNNVVNSIQQFLRFRGANTRVEQSNKNIMNREANGICWNCEQNWTSTHRQVCPALDKKCKNCGLLNHFAKVCRKERNINNNTQQGKRKNNVENPKTTENSE